MLTSIHPKLPMRNKTITRAFYLDLLEMKELGDPDFPAYFMCQKDTIELHFFLHESLEPKDNYGQVYIRTNDIHHVYNHLLQRNIEIHPNGKLSAKPWGQLEFSLLDPDLNLITFGQAIS